MSKTFSDASLLSRIVLEIAKPLAESRITHVWGIEARGLYLASALAIRLGAGLVPVRKPGKLPSEVFQAQGQVQSLMSSSGVTVTSTGKNSTYHKDYIFEVSKSAVQEAQRILIVDDILARGGSIDATRRIARMAGSEIVEAVTIIELQGLGGRSTLQGIPLRTLVKV